MMEDELVKVFAKESLVHLDSIKSDLLELQKNIDNIDSDILNGIFRAMHSIKGASGFYHFQKIGELSYTMESLLSQLRYGKIKPSKGLIQSFLAGAALLSSMLKDINKSEQYNIKDEIELLTSYLKQNDKPAKIITIQESSGKSGQSNKFEIAEDKLENFLKTGLDLYSLKFDLKRDLTLKGKTPFDIINEINKHGEFIESSLDVDSVQGLEDCLDIDLPFIVVFGTDFSLKFISKFLGIPEDRISAIDLTEQKIKYGFGIQNDLNPEKDTLFLTPTTDLVASQIEKLRDFFLQKLKAYPNVSKVVFKADNIENVDSLGVNLIIGIYRQVKSESKIFEITGAGEKFLKVAKFFQFPSLFSIKSKEPTK